MPCTQEPVIDSIQKTLERMERTQEKLVTMLEKVADQGARINSLEGHIENSEQASSGMAARIRALELAQATNGPELRLSIQEAITDLSHNVDQVLTKTSIMTSKPVYVLFTAMGVLTLIGTICDITYHFDTFKAFLSLIKG